MATARNFGPQDFEPTSATNLADPLHRGLHEELLQRRQRLEQVLSRGSSVRLLHLLEEVDAALGRLHSGAYGICELCHEPIETERMLANPLACFCLDHLPPDQLRALEADLELAARLQARLLPPRDFRSDGWRASYSYQPAGMVSGDYCDLLTGPDNSLFFALGDVSGKGVAASLLMSNLSAMFRTLVPLGVPLDKLMEHANRVFCDSTLPTQFATLVCGRAAADGQVEIYNAGHPAPLVFTRDGARSDFALDLGPAGFPIGLFCEQPSPTSRLRLAPGDSILLFSDGISEASNREEQEYGGARLQEVAGRCAGLAPAETVLACIRDVTAFRGDVPITDDQTLMVVQRSIA